jgi:hypothetical protein
MTRKRFSKEQQQQRLERFRQFLEAQHLSCYPLPQATPARPSFIVYRQTALMRVTFNFTGGIWVAGLPSLLRATVLGWVRQEQPHYHDQTHQEQARKDLDYYRFLLTPPSEPLEVATHDSQVSDEGIILTPSDHPLVEVVTRLGYQVQLFPFSPRYRLSQGQHVLASGVQLIEVVVALFEGHKHDNPPPLKPGTDITPVVETPSLNRTLASLMEMANRLANEDLELTCVLSLPVRLQLYHPHAPMGPDQTDPQLERGYSMELKIPPTPDPAHPFKPEHITRTFGDSYLLSEAVYPSWSSASLRLEDIVYATGIDPTARIWSVRNLANE